MSEQFHLVNQLAHHDAAIGALSSRMTGVEASLTHVQERVGALDNKVSAGFSGLEALIRESRATQGPSMPDVLKGLVTGGALIAMSAGAITVLVTSFVNPDLVALQHKTVALSERLADTHESLNKKIDRVEADLATHSELAGHQGGMAIQQSHEQRLDRLEDKIDSRGVGAWATDIRSAR